MDIMSTSINQIGLSVRSSNALHRHGVNMVADLLQCNEEQLFAMRNVGKKSVEEILGKIEEYRELAANSEIYLQLGQESESADQHPQKRKLQADNTYQIKGIDARQFSKAVRTCLQPDDRQTENLGFSDQTAEILLQNGITSLQDIFSLTTADLLYFNGMSQDSASEILHGLSSWLVEHAEKIPGLYTARANMIQRFEQAVLQLFIPQPFQGFSLSEMKEALPDTVQVPDSMLKEAVGRLLHEKKLEYVDFRCYRIYPGVEEYLAECQDLDDRARDIMRRRLHGETLESIAKDNGITRERVRQIASKSFTRLKSSYKAQTKLDVFDEDYYRYLFETYYFEKNDGTAFLGIPQNIWNYLDMSDAPRGRKDLQEALDDPKLDVGMRLKIKTFLNRNRLFIDGRWIERNRADLEETAVRLLCQDSVSYERFTQLYNEFLEQEEVEYDENLYYTPSVYATRKNRLSEARFLLWKQNEQLRWYDIEGQDFTELLETLNLDSYENIDLSTVKFMEEYPEIMQRYDIRDQYELHNLLRKIIPDGEYHDFHCGRMPVIRFGHFDRDAAIRQLMKDNAPISQTDLAALIHQEYGFDEATVMGAYLQCIDPYFHQGMYSVTEKIMSRENMTALLEQLPDDFYYTHEIRDIYTNSVENADPEEINPYNLKEMGFIVYSSYVVKNHPSIDAYCTDLLTSEDITDINEYRNRLSGVQLFSAKLMTLKRSLEVIEFSRNKLINIRKLEQSGVTKQMIHEDCNRVFQFVKDGDYFSIRSLRQAGFSWDLEDLGFEDWFYGSLLLSDERLSSGIMFGVPVFYKGNQKISIQSFLIWLMDQLQETDTYDLMHELEETYGCQVHDRMDPVYKLRGTKCYYDSILERLYSNVDIYEKELEEADGWM